MNLISQKTQISIFQCLFASIMTIVTLSASAAGTCLHDESVAEMLDRQKKESSNPEDLFKKLLDTPTCSSTKNLTPLSQAPNTVSIYTAADIANLGARTISDVLKIIAGIQVQTNPNNRETVWIRGVPSEFNNKVTLYIDNVPYKTVFGGFPIDEELPIETIKRIEVIKGAGSALYGANALSGVINIYTFKPSEKNKNRLKTSVGERDTVLGFFSLGHQFEDIANVMLEGKWLTTDGRKPFYNREGGKNNQTGDQDFAYLRFKASAFDDKLSISANYSEFDNKRIDKPSNFDNSRKHENLRFSIAYQDKINENFSYETLAYYTLNSRTEIENNYSIVDNSLTTSFEFIDEVEQAGVNLLTTINPIEDNQLTLGFEYKRERLAKSEFHDRLTGNTLTFVQDPRYSNLALNDFGFFIQDRQGFFDNKLFLNAGLRFDKLDLFSDQFSYRFGLTYAINKEFFTKFLYGTAYRAPNFVEFVRAPVNAQLPDVETMETVEAQLGYQGERLQANVTFYYSQYDDFIFRRNSFHEGSQNLSAGVFGNVDDLDIIGIEFESKFVFNQNWDGFLNLAWTNARSEQQEQLMPLQTTKTLSAGIQYHQRLGDGELQLNNHVIVYDARKDWDSNIWDVGQQQRYPNRKDDFNSGFVVWNAGLHYDWNLAEKHTLKFSLTVHNLLDEEYYTQTSTPPQSDNIAFFDTQYQRRHTRFSISYSF